MPKNIAVDSSANSKSQSQPDLTPLEQQVVDVFVDGMRVLGLPPSIGEIYGLLFITEHPLSLDDLVGRLSISKGSASQGLRLLKELGAAKEVQIESERRTYYEPAVDLKKLVGGFIREQIRPHLESGKNKVQLLADAANQVENPARKEFLSERIERLDHWMNRSGKVLPILQKLLGQ